MEVDTDFDFEAMADQLRKAIEEIAPDREREALMRHVELDRAGVTD